MPEESATLDLVELTRSFYETMDRKWDFGALAGFFAPDALGLRRAAWRCARTACVRACVTHSIAGEQRRIMHDPGRFERGRIKD
jgi:hypothetical protein